MVATTPVDVIEMGTRIAIIDEKFMAIWLKDVDPAKWYRIDGVTDEIKTRAIALWQQIAGFTFSKHTGSSPVHIRHRAMTASKWPGFLNIPKYQVQGGANLFLADVLRDALNHANYAALDLSLMYMDVDEGIKDLFPRAAKGTAEAWALEIMQFRRKSDPTFPETIDELYAATKARVTDQQWSNIERQIKRKVEPMTKPAAQQAIVPEENTKRWCDDPGTWKILCESTSAALVGDRIEFIDIEDVMLQICGVVGSKEDIICSKDEFYKLRAAWIKENKPQVEKTLNSEFPRESDADPTLRVNPIHGNANPAPDADDMPEPGPIEKAFLSDNKKFQAGRSELFDKYGVPQATRHSITEQTIGTSTEWKNTTENTKEALRLIERWLIVEYPIGTPKEQAIAVVRFFLGEETSVDDIIATIKAALQGQSIDQSIAAIGRAETMNLIKDRCRFQTDNQTPIAPSEKATPMNDDAISGEIVSETPKAPEIPANEAALKNIANEARAVNKALAAIDRNLVQYQPHPYWLTSPQWQVSPFDMAKFVADSRLFKNADTPAKALAIIFKGVEIGIGPMAALEHLNIIDGKPPSCDGALMLALLRKAGISVEFLERTDKICKLKMTRPDNGNSIVQQFTFEEAQKAGLTNKGNWKYARAMLTWRAVSEAAKLIASDMMIMGGIPMYTHEEINPDAILNEDGTLAA